MVGVLVAPAFSASGQVLGKREEGALPTSLLFAWSMSLGGALLLGAGPAFEPRRLTLDGRALGAIAYLALAGSALTLVALGRGWCVLRQPASEHAP